LMATVNQGEQLGSELSGSSEPNCSPWFTVAINQPLTYDLEFNWWIIKLEPEESI